MAGEELLDIEAFKQSIQSAQGGAGTFAGLPRGDAVTKLVDEKAQPGKSPLYYDAFVYMPNLLDWAPDKKAALQDQLVSSGLLAKDFRRGAWDDASAEAFGQVVALANQSNTTWEQTLESYVNQQPMTYDPKTGTFSRGVGGKTSREVAPLVTKYSNPDDIAGMVNKVARTRIGRALDPDELNKFVSTYQGMEGSFQQKAYNQGNAAGGSVTSEPSIETAANQAVEEIDPVAAQARNMLPMVDEIKKLMAGSEFKTAAPMGG